MENYKVGDKVRINTVRGIGWNPDGKMDKWMGQIMTIRKTDEDELDLFYMEEDIDENCGGWCWDIDDFTPAPEETESPTALSHRYHVIRTADGHTMYECFVLLPDSDPAAAAAIRAYALATDNEMLTKDLLAWVGYPENKPLTLDDLRQSIGEPVWVVWTDGRIKSRWYVVGDSDWRDMEFFDEYCSAGSRYGKEWLAYLSKLEEEQK